MDNSLNFLEKIQHYIFNNLLSVIWTASLLVGGFIFWLYFSGIQYFPDLDFDESVLFLVVAAITGIFFLLLLAFLFMSPYFFRGMMPLEQPKPSFLIMPSSPSDKEKASDIDERAWYFGSIFIANLALLSYFFLDHICKNPWFSFGVPALILVVIICGHYQFYFKPLSKKELFGAWTISAFFSLFPLILVLLLVEKTGLESDFDQLSALIALLAIVMCSNIIFAYYNEQKAKPWWLWSIPFLTVFLVLFIAREPLIPKLVMNKFKFGIIRPNSFWLMQMAVKFLKI